VKSALVSTRETVEGMFDAIGPGVNVSSLR
jgi:hypothetical protein